jgi:polyisoprenoid-binding protein YceI
MQKKVIISILVVVLLIIGFSVFGSQRTNTQNQLSQVANTSSQNVNTEVNLGSEDESKIYQLSPESNISYTVQKEFFSKPGEVITATTNSFDLDLDLQENLLSVEASLDTGTLDSGNGDRDDHVANDLGQFINIKVENFEVDLLEQPTFTAPVLLTINNVDKVVNFQIESEVTENETSFVGTSNINMKDFGVEPPSFAGVYAVNENVELAFDIKVTN